MLRRSSLRKRSSNIEFMSGRLTMEGKTSVKGILKDLSVMLDTLEDIHLELSSPDSSDEVLTTNIDVSNGYDALEMASAQIIKAISSFERATR